MVRLLLPLANGGRAHLLYRARGRDPATGRCLPSRSNFRTGEEMTVPHTPRARARTKKVGGQISPWADPDHPCSWCAGVPVWPVVVMIRGLRTRARVLWVRVNAV